MRRDNDGIEPPEEWVSVYEFVKDQYPKGLSKNELRILRNILKNAHEQETSGKRRFLNHYDSSTRKGGWGSFH